MTQDIYNEGRLSEDFHNAIANSRDHRIEDFYGTDLDAIVIINLSEKFAEIILNGAKDIVAEESVENGQRKLQGLFSGPESPAVETLTSHVIQVLDEKIGRRVVVVQATAEKRIKKLILIGKKALTDSRTAECLRKVSQCYLFGLDEQCVIMCRSALEGAYLQAFPDYKCNAIPKVHKEPRYGRTKPEYTLDDRICAADVIGKREIQALSQLARLVKNKANDLIHPDRELRWTLDEKNLDMILLQTIEVVSGLAYACEEV